MDAHAVAEPRHRAKLLGNAIELPVAVGVDEHGRPRIVRNRVEYPTAAAAAYAWRKIWRGSTVRRSRPGESRARAPRRTVASSGRPATRRTTSSSRDGPDSDEGPEPSAATPAVVA